VDPTFAASIIRTVDLEDRIARIRRGYESFNRGDLDAVLADLAPDIQVEERAEAPDPRRASGREQALEAFRSLRDDFDDYHFEPREFHVEGDHIVVVARQSAVGRLSGVPVEGEIVHAWLVIDDQIAGLRAFSTLEEALEAIRSGAGEPTAT
jgi:ketosteroid isomerase-like protein